MNTNQKVRALRKIIRKISNEHQEWMYMDLAMDGSGDCGSMICRFHQETEQKRQQALFHKIGMTAEEYEKHLKDIIKEEAKHLTPKPWDDVPLAYNDLCNLNIY